MIAKGIGLVLHPAFRLFFHFLILPIYRIAVITRIRLQKVIATARGSLFLIFTNRYVFHAVLLVISVATIGMQWQTRHANASNAGKQSILYALVTEGQDELIEEEVRPELLTKNANYLGADTIQSVPSVDYDYEEEETPVADLTVPGSIAVQPGAEQPNASEEPKVIARAQTETYTVMEGDTVAAIARRFGVNVGTVIWANNLGARAFIKPGNTLKIPAVSGVLHIVKRGDTISKIASLYGVDAERVISANHIDAGRGIAIGEEIVVPGGMPPAPPISRAKPIALRPNVPRTAIRNKSYDEYQELVKPDTRLKPSDLPESDISAPRAKLLWPTRLHLINQYYGWRHTGLDVDGDYTDPIYASADGVVEKSGWNSGGYGLQIIIDHQNGLRTRYAHASKLFVQEGDRVKRGQVIAMVGTTGRSTGTHLHFEVYNNDRRSNPLAFIR